MPTPIPPLVPFHRTVKLPPDLWAAVKATTRQRGTSSRRVVANALDAELAALVAALRALGLDADRVFHAQDAAGADGPSTAHSAFHA